MLQCTPSAIIIIIIKYKKDKNTHKKDKKEDLKSMTHVYILSE
jgi:hypothetical protein